jgi:hypothetical protein
VGTSTFKVRFRLTSDGWIHRDGWYVDDVHVFADEPTGVDDGALSIASPTVSNFPNPFNPRTTVQYGVPKPSSVSLRVYDVSGRLVRTLVDAGAHGAGRYDVGWDGADERGVPVAGGVYFARLTVGEDTASTKLVLLK